MLCCHTFIEGGKNMDGVLTSAVRKIRKCADWVFQKPVTLIHTSGSTYQLYFATKGCKYACTLCYYGSGANYSDEEVEKELDNILDNFPKDVKVLVLEASGSFLDEGEISRDLRKKILERIARVRGPEFIVFETHYSTVTESVIQEIKEAFCDSDVQLEFEFGLESTDENVLKLYNKDINLQALRKVIWTINSYGIACELNILLGAPTLTVSEQIRDTLNSIDWVMKNCPTSTTCVLFPINIKKYTLFWKLWENGKYDLIYQWEFVIMLSRIPKEYLGRIYIAWWGNRSNYYDGEEAIKHPYSCDTCHAKLQEFYEEFYQADKEVKIKLLDDIMTQSCECKETALRRLQEEKIKMSISVRFLILREWVKENLL